MWPVGHSLPTPGVDKDFLVIKPYFIQDKTLKGIHGVLLNN